MDVKTMHQIRPKIKTVILHGQNTSAAFKAETIEDVTAFVAAMLCDGFRGAMTAGEVHLYAPRSGGFEDVTVPGSKSNVAGSNPEIPGSNPVPMGSVVPFPGSKPRHRLDTDYLRGLWTEGGAV